MADKADPNELLRRATALKQTGMITSAIDCLLTAYEEISKTSIDYGTKTFLRLPLYLQSAGRTDDGWREFNRLITIGYPNQSKSEGYWEEHLSQVYDKMRLFLQKEGRSKQAIIYGVLAYISDLRGRFLRGKFVAIQKQYFDQYTTENATISVLAPLLKKAGLAQLQAPVFNLIREWIVAIPDADDAAFENQLSQLLS